MCYFIYEHKCATASVFNEIRDTIIADGIKTYIVFQKAMIVYIIHACPKRSAQKCKCDHYRPMCPPSKYSSSRNNSNFLSGTNPEIIFAEIVEALKQCTDLTLNTYCNIMVSLC